MSMLASANPVVWFEIPANDLDRAMTFYRAVFDIEMQSLDLGELRFGFFPMQEGAPNGAGALVQHGDMYWPSHKGALVYFSVHDIEVVLGRVAANGGRIFQHRKEVGQFGFVGFFEDSEGNRVGLHTAR